MGKILFIAVIAGIAYGFYSGWFDMGAVRGDAQSAGCAKARATVQETESRMSTGGGAVVDANAKERLAQAREFIAANCR